MEILLWLVPSVVVTVLAMLWVGWLGREGRGEVERDVAVRRLASALEPDTRRRRRRPAPGYAVTKPDPDRSTGIAVRPSRRAS
ncbi:hypothetical protein [Nocardioides caricicola]|uniref:Uncharacterized protein n=1 Tax=Nocardioides caricicola TaxID=634770 RepID=A0ABW0N3I1_9ACTN